MKHLLSLLVTLLFYVTTTGQSYLGTISKQANLREGPGVNFKIMKPLSAGKIVFIISAEPENDFYHVIDIESNKEGYVHRSLVRIGREVSKNSEGIFNPKGSITSYNAEIEIYNNTSKKLTLRLNSEVFTFQPKEKRTLSIAPGAYNYIASAPAVIPDYGTESVSSNSAYTWEFYIITGYK